MSGSVDVSIPDPTGEPVEPTETTEPTAAERPAWLPEKFKSPEDFATAYGELETKLGQPAKEATATEEPTDADSPPSGLDLNKYAEEFVAQGELTEASYQELQSQGIPKEMVDTYVNGLQSKEAELADVVYRAAGSQTEFNQIADWAGNNLQDTELEAFNKALDSRDPVMMRMATESLVARYSAANGKIPNLIEGGPALANAGVYEDDSQVHADMRDPLYESSPAFRSKVMAKIENTMKAKGEL